MGYSAELNATASVPALEGWWLKRCGKDCHEATTGLHASLCGLEESEHYSQALARCPSSTAVSRAALDFKNGVVVPVEQAIIHARDTAIAYFPMATRVVRFLNRMLCNRR